jgi:Gpi18-like mannosyltransferase
MFRKRINWLLIILFIVALLIRLCTITWVIHGDLIMQAGWGRWIYDHGWFGFYENNQWIYGWPNHPPLISLVYGLGFQLSEWLNTLFVAIGNFIALNRLGASKIPWFYNFIVWASKTKYVDTPFSWGNLISMKLIVVIADLVLGGMIYKIAKSISNQKTALIIAALYLLSPFSWYESSIWGQNDQLGLIFLLISFWFLTKDRFAWLATIAIAISVLLKPTGFIFIPLFFWFALKNKKRFMGMIYGGIMDIILYFILVKLTTTNDILTFSVNLYRQMLIKGELWTWVNTFNFWRLVTPYLTDCTHKFLFLSYQIWGYLIYAGFHIYVFNRYKKRDWLSGLNALFIISFAGWLFLVTMHERYLFTAVVTGLIICSQNLKMLKYWLFLSLIFTINMFNGWWTPSIPWLKNILTWGNFMDGPIPRVLSFANLFIFGQMLKSISAKQKNHL